MLGHRLCAFSFAAPARDAVRAEAALALEWHPVHNVRAPGWTIMIRVNDKLDVEWREGLTVQSTLEACGFTHRQVVVSVNGVLIPPGEYETTAVSDEATVRVVHIVGGG